MSPAARVQPLVAAMLALGALGVGPARDDTKPVPLDLGLGLLLSERCIDCHDRDRPKGRLNLEDPAEAGVIEASVLRGIRRRIIRGDMPPPDDDDPIAQEARQALVEGIDRQLPPRASEVPLVRRLNRWQYASAVRDAIGGDDASLAHLLHALSLSGLPADDVGEGFDTTADVLAVTSLLMDKYLRVAERIAAAAVHDPGDRATHSLDASAFRYDAGGAFHGGMAHLSQAGSVHAHATLPRAGRYRLTVPIGASRAGPEPARYAIRASGSEVCRGEATAPVGAPAAVTVDTHLEGGPVEIAVSFLNDFWDPRNPDPEQRDRNLAVGSISIDGPLDPGPPTSFERRMEVVAGSGSLRKRLRLAASSLGEELFRRGISGQDAVELERVAQQAVTGPATWNATLRALVTAILIDPRFILRVEQAVPPPLERASLAPDELAERMSFFIWSSVPDRTLREAASRGDLADDTKLRAQVHRMLDDGRAASLADRFCMQWLGVDAIDQRSPDPKLFPEASPSAIARMGEETRMLCRRMTRGELPVRGLFDAEGIARPCGLLTHPSILLATSNPSRTSPVKRGKWVMEALLDAAPPPPPPGAPTLPEQRVVASAQAMREALAEHRRNPECAQCHVTMDALGLAFEHYDGAGSWRDAAGGLPIDDSSSLPGGRAISGVKGVRAFILEGHAYERSLARHLLVYALGRGTSDADDQLIEQLAINLHARGSFPGLVESIVASEPFRTRRAAPRSGSAAGSP